MVTYLEPGIYSGVPIDDYHADRLTPEPALSSSRAKRLIATCPAIVRHEMLHPPAPSSAFKVGSAAHEWLLEGDRWPSRHYVTPEGFDRRKTRQMAAEIAAAEEAEAAGLRVISHEEFETVKAMRAALEAHEFIMHAFTGEGLAEQTVVWRDETHGIWCRARFDFCKPRQGLIPDYKTAVDVSPSALRRAVFNFGYHQQAAWYIDAALAVGLFAEPPAFLLVFQMKEPPYLVVPAVLTQEAIEWGRALNERAKAIFARCLRTGEWPGYADDVLTIDLPEFAPKAIRRQLETEAQ